MRLERLAVVALMLLFAPLWPVGFLCMTAYAAFMGGWEAALAIMQRIDRE